jgi:DUF1365 family protein
MVMNQFLRDSSARSRPVSGALSNAALYECRIIHVRTVPMRNIFTYCTYLWLVDIDDLPKVPIWLRPLVRFASSDHLGDPKQSIRENIESYLCRHGIDLAGGQIRMLTHARVLGYVFNPITLYWCHNIAGTLECVIAEVHNTYGEQHSYLLRTDARNSAEAKKEFYVSPFYGVDGWYRMNLPEPGQRLAITIALHRSGNPPFVASVQGARRSASVSQLLRLYARHPLSTAVVTFRIRWQGLKLYCRGLPVVDRSTGG